MSKDARYGRRVADVIRPAPGVVIPIDELTIRASASGGPGGQHANTSNTRIEVVFDVVTSPSLPEWARDRLIARVGPVVRSSERTQRSQLRNKELALASLEQKLAAALRVERTRRPTRATLGSKQRRLQSKTQRSQTKSNRRRPNTDD